MPEFKFIKYLSPKTSPSGAISPVKCFTGDNFVTGDVTGEDFVTGDFTITAITGDTVTADKNEFQLCFVTLMFYFPSESSKTFSQDLL